METIKVVAVPEGEAPLWVRQAWVGCVLPVEKVTPGEKITAWSIGKGVLTGEITDLMREWFWISPDEAIKMLVAQDRSCAVAWWRDVCRLLEGEMLLFKPEECEVIVLDSYQSSSL